MSRNLKRNTVESINVQLMGHMFHVTEEKQFQLKGILHLVMYGKGNAKCQCSCYSFMRNIVFSCGKH